MDRILDLLVKQDHSDPEVFIGQGLDISGSGMSIFCEKKLVAGDCLDLEFRVFRYPAVSLKVYAKVARVQEMIQEGKTGFRMALEFLDLEESEKEWIISYVFQVQRESIRKKRNN